MANHKQAQANGKVPVTIENFNRAETDIYMSGIVNQGAFGKFNHNRKPTSIENQNVIRMNRDTLYSMAVFDLDASPVTITLPDAGSRYIAMQLINEDHYTLDVIHKGSITVDRDKAGTRYLTAIVRILVDPDDAEDLKTVNALQDSVKIEQASNGKFEIPDWDLNLLSKIRNAIAVIAEYSVDFTKRFGSKEDVDPVRFLIGTATGWGGNPESEAIYLGFKPEKNDGKTVYKLNVKDVPADGFWSVSVYNKDGFFEKNDFNSYSLNSITAKKNDDGSITIQFGGCDGKIPNCIPITPGWNYIVRLYLPRKEVIDGTWKFPEPVAE